ncbi:MAG: penicillin-binding transpeptidase domain-containing protein, partial [Bacteroidota bacterium]
KACQIHNADHGCAIVMEVKTGKIRAIANIGRTGEGWWETYNYAVGEKVEPGSMFKLASFMAMMEEGKLPALDASVPVYRGKKNFHGEELEDAHQHGLDFMTVKQVFAQSSNVGTATLVEQAFGANPSAFYDQLVKFGLDKVTEIEIGGEEPPLIKDPRKEKWSGTTLPWMSIGYELLITPLQMLAFYNAVANNGRMMKPWLVQRTERYGEVIKEFQPKVISRSIASETTIRKAKELLKEVVQSGTASGIRSEHFSMAGKTGTTQLNYHHFQTSDGIGHRAAFCGFFPADNPVYSCIVVISEPQLGGYHGAEVAAPVFKAIAERCYAMKAELQTPVNAGKRKSLQASLMPNGDAGTINDLKKALEWLGLDYKYPGENSSDWSVLIAANDSVKLERRSISNNSVPSVAGMGLKDALYLLENRNCKVKVVGVGKVRRQSLEPGTVARGSTCILYLE